MGGKKHVNQDQDTAREDAAKDLDGEGEKGEARDRDAMRRLKKEDFQEIARFGSEIFKRTVSSGIDVIREGIPKEATQFLAGRKEDMFKGIPKDVAQALVSAAMDRTFAFIRQHKLEISIRFKRIDDDSSSGRKAPQEGSGHRAEGKHEARGEGKPRHDRGKRH